MSAGVATTYLGQQLRRLATAVLCLGLFVFGGYRLACSCLDRRLEGVLAAADAATPGWRLEQLQAARAAVPDAENAALVVQRLARGLPDKFLQTFFVGTTFALQGDPLGRSSAARSLPPLQVRESLLPEQEKALRAALKPYAASAEAARLLVGYQRGRYAIEHGPDVSTPAPAALGLYQVVFLLRHDALLAVHDGRTRDALTNSRAILVAGRSLGDEPAPTYQVKRLECWDDALNVLERALAHGRAAAEDLEAVQPLLEAEADEPLAWMLLSGELAMCHLRFSALEAGELHLFASRYGRSRYSPPIAPLFDWLARDAIKVSHAGVVDYLSHRAAAARLPEPQQTIALRQLERSSSAEPMTGGWLGEWRSRRLLRFVRRGQLRLRTAAVALAAQRYRLRHGTWPETLQALAPDYVAAIPDDPHGEGPLRYVRLADGVVIYSIGRDGRDNGGRVHAQPDTPGSDIGFRLWDDSVR